MTALVSVLMIFGWIGIVSFGGGLAVVPEMHRQLVDVHGWLSVEEFRDGYAFGQLAPGPNMLSVVFYGYRIAGPPGALVAPVCAFGPGAVASALFARAWTTAAQRPAIRAVRRGLVPVGAGLVAGGVLVLARETTTTWKALLLLGLVVVAVQRKWLSNALSVVLAGLAGAFVEM